MENQNERIRRPLNQDSWVGKSVYWLDTSTIVNPLMTIAATERGWIVTHDLGESVEVNDSTIPLPKSNLGINEPKEEEIGGGGIPPTNP